MGYTTDFQGRIEIVPPLNPEEIKFLRKFNQTRRMRCTQGPYYVDRGGLMGQDDERKDPGVLDYNSPPEGQPGLWCQWTVTDEGDAIEWDDGEKFYDSAEWMKYLIRHFLQPGCLAQEALPFLQGNHVCNGTIEAQGEDSSDRWDLVVTDNKVYRRNYETRAVGEPEEV